VTATAVPGKADVSASCSIGNATGGSGHGALGDGAGMAVAGENVGSNSQPPAGLEEELAWSVVLVAELGTGDGATSARAGGAGAKPANNSVSSLVVSWPPDNDGGCAEISAGGKAAAPPTTLAGRNRFPVVAPALASAPGSALPSDAQSDPVAPAPPKEATGPLLSCSLVVGPTVSDCGIDALAGAGGAGGGDRSVSDRAGPSSGAAWGAEVEDAPLPTTRSATRPSRRLAAEPSVLHALKAVGVAAEAEVETGAAGIAEAGAAAPDCAETPEGSGFCVDRAGEAASGADAAAVRTAAAVLVGGTTVVERGDDDKDAGGGGDAC